jgi:alanine dehydrogenase
MKIGCVREIKNNEYRVGLTPDNVKSYIAAGHTVMIEKGAGVGSGFEDAEYIEAGAEVIENANVKIVISKRSNDIFLVIISSK